MTYKIVKRQQRRSQLRTLRGAVPGGLGDAWDDLGWFLVSASGNSAVSSLQDQLAPYQVADCVAKASASTAAMDAARNDVIKNWQPSGYYSPDQVGQICSMVVAALTTSRTALASITGSGAADTDAVVAAGTGDIDLLMGAMPGRSVTAQTFLVAAADAQLKQIQIIAAPGLKKWVVDCMMATQKAAIITATLNCLSTWLDKVETMLDSVRAVVIAVGIGIADAVVKAAKAAGQAIAAIPDALSTIWTMAKWGLVLGGGYLAYREYQKRK